MVRLLLCIIAVLIVTLSGGVGVASRFQDVLKFIDANRLDLTLKNGLKVVILEISDAKSVNIALSFNAGSLYETKPGVAFLTSQALLFKNRKYGMLEIPRYIESLGGSIDSSSGHDLSTITVKCLSEDVYECLSRLLDIVTGFEVDEEVLSIIKPNIISSIKVKGDDPWDYTRKLFLREIYGDHPYGREPEGDEEDVKKVEVGDVREFFKNFYTPDNAVLAVVGKVDKGKVAKFLEDNFSMWKGKKTRVTPPEVKTVAQRKEVRVSKALKQSTVRVGHLSTNIKDPNRVELKILNFILGGGGFGSRLMEKIREREGLAYGVFSNFYIDRKLAGYFFVGTQTENKNVPKVVEIITNEIRSIIDVGVTEKELEETKNYSEGSLLLSMESFSSLSSFLISEKMFELERNYFVKDVEKISVIRKEDINRVAKDYLNPDRLTVVIVGGE